MRKCDGCRFSKKNNNQNIPCGQLRTRMGIERHECKGDVNTSFEPLLKLRMKVQIRPELYSRFELNSNIKENTILTLKSYSCPSWSFEKHSGNYNEWWFQECKSNFKLTHEGEKQLDKYEFKGEVNIGVIVNDAIEENKRSFIIMGKNNSVVGILRDTIANVENGKDDVIYNYGTGEFVSIVTSNEYPFIFKIIENESVNSYIKLLREEKKQFYKKLRKEKKRIKNLFRKGENKQSRFKVFAI